MVISVGDWEQLDDPRMLRALAGTLRTADPRHRRGELTSVHYERIWWQAYAALAAQRSIPQNYCETNDFN
jgi:hypothetical protein